MAKNAASVVASNRIDKILKINMCAVIGAVGNRSYRSKRNAVIAAHLRDRRAFYFISTAKASCPAASSAVCSASDPDAAPMKRSPLAIRPV